MRKKIILGSASKWRRHILAEAGYEFKVMTADIDERNIRDADPEQLVLKIAHAKADAILPQINKKDREVYRYLLTCDQVVYCHHQVFEKPQSADEIRYFISHYQQYSAATYTAVLITDLKSSKQFEGVDIVNVTFHAIPEAVIQHVIDEGEVFHCAGGFQIEDEEGELNPYIKSIDGDIDSVKGLPMRLLKKLIETIN